MARSDAAGRPLDAKDRPSPQDFRAWGFEEASRNFAAWLKNERGLPELWRDFLRIRMRIRTKRRSGELSFVPDQGDAHAHYMRGAVLFYEGLYDKAAALFAKSAEQGDLDARVALGVCFEFGLGVARECWSTALQHYHDAAAQDHENAQKLLSRLQEKIEAERLHGAGASSGERRPASAARAVGQPSGSKPKR
jgi:hypothetical protein